MAKEKKSTLDTRKAQNKADEATEKYGPNMTLAKYFQLFDPPVHIYTRSALIEQNRGIMKRKGEWETMLEEFRGE